MFDTSITKVCDHPRPTTTICDHPRPAMILPPPPKTTHDQAQVRRYHPRPTIILPPPPTARHNFTPPPTTTHNQSLFHRHHPQPPATWPTIIKWSLIPNNNISHNPPRNNKFWTIFLPPLLTQQNSKSNLNYFATTHRAPRDFFFQKVWTVFIRNLLITNANEAKIKKQYHLSWVHFCVN